MKQLYKKINDNTVNKTVNKLMKRPPRGNWKYFRIGIKLRGGGFDLAKDVIIRELEFMNTKSYEQLIEYHPKKFMLAMDGTRWARSGLEFYPGASHEYVYIGKCLSSYKNKNGLLDMDSVDCDFQSIQLDISEFNRELCYGEMMEKEGVEPILESKQEFLPFFPHAKEVYVCHKTKTIVVFFEFKVMFYEPKAAKMRLDSWKYDPKYYIKDKQVLNHQLAKIRQVSEELNVPGIDDPAGFIYWMNTGVTKDEIRRVLSIYYSIGCGSLQYYKECKAEILKSEFGEMFKDYTIRSATTTYDPFTGNRYGTARNNESVSEDLSNNQIYKEMYE